MGWCLFTCLMVWVFIQFGDTEDVGSCNMQRCNNNFLSRTKTLRPGPYRFYCVHLKQYMECVQEQAQACHGDIMFHATKISVGTLFEDNRCEEILAQEVPGGSDAAAAEDEWYLSSPLPDDPCEYKGPPSNPAHCGLFGDPHLKTFNGTFMTCRVKGAWPMLSSSHLAIQVTNEAVAPDFKATATTKVTVLIKSSTDCGTAKMYEASGDSLPKAFIDGTTFSGSDKSRPFANVTESVSGRHVIIKLKSINTVVSIRKIGNYLSVSVTMPEAVVGALSESLQLCVGGCPSSEQLSEGVASAPKTPAMSEVEATALCLEHNVTDYYLDSCVFDLVTTGDLTFRDAASLSLKDLWAEDPKTSYSVLRNCSAWPCMWKVASGQNTIYSNTIFLIFSTMLSYIINSPLPVQCFTFPLNCIHR